MRVTRANAITFTGGVNSLTLQSGFSILGNVVAVSGGTDTFALGGAANSSFDTTQIGVQYQNFTAFNKTGASVWTLTGTPGQATPWLISDGTLKAGAATNVFGVDQRDYGQHPRDSSISAASTRRSARSPAAAP